MLKRILFMLSLWLSMVSTLVCQSTYSLDTLWVYAQKNYPLLGEIQLMDQIDAYSRDNASKVFLPQLDVSLIGGGITGLPDFLPNQTSPNGFKLIGNFQFNQLIWDGGRTKAQQSLTQGQTQVEKAQLNVTMYSLKERVMKPFFALLFVEEQKKKLNLLKDRLERTLERTQAGFDNGLRFQSDIDQIRVELINVEQQAIQLHYQEESYRKVLSILCGIEMGEADRLQKPDLYIESMEDFGLRPEFKLFDSQLDLLERQRQVNKSVLLPRVGLIGYGLFLTPGVSFGPSSLNHLLVGGVSLSWNLGGLYRKENNKALLDIQQSRVEVQRALFLFNQELQSLQYRSQTSTYKALIDSDEELIRLKKSIVESHQAQYDNGIITLAQLLDALNQQSMAEQNKSLHEIQYLQSQYQLKIQSGK